MLENLRKITKSAIEKQKADRLAKEEEEKSLLERKNRENSLIASNVLQRLKFRCEEAANNGHYRVDIYEMKYTTDYTLSWGKAIDTFQIIPNSVADYIITGIKKLGLNYELTQWHDGVGINGGYNITVVWE